MLFIGSFSLIPLAWFVISDLQLNRWWIVIALFHPVMLVVPVLYHFYKAKKGYNHSTS